ncbi:hypothetical protein EVAR_29301_1 [Eumeta japonica]|uniref:Uncharacterized protein n=1 Tax=Eumeta variegata TaxID=151549 RepID=A0A4C1VXD6_EUMVA|nr:hypothetical protein EVAR_29301_1 [Eumeta japonica]
MCILHIAAKSDCAVTVRRRQVQSFELAPIRGTSSVKIRRIIYCTGCSITCYTRCGPSPKRSPTFIHVAVYCAGDAGPAIVCLSDSGCDCRVICGHLEKCLADVLNLFPWRWELFAIPERDVGRATGRNNIRRTRGVYALWL